MPQIVQVISTKYNGSLREKYEALLKESDGSVVQLSVPRGTPVWGEKLQRWVETDTDAVDIYFADRWYNVYHYGSSAPYLWYCNIAMPATFDGKTLRWVDLEIDVLCHLDRSLTVEDEDEFEATRVEMDYPDEVARSALAARDEVLGLASDSVFPFDHKVQMRRCT